jgi:hypothetical protein
MGSARRCRMRALTRLSYAEFSKAFHWKSGTPEAHDFLWLTIFFVLCAFLLFFGVSADQGLGDRFQQVLLGALPNSSPPVRVNYHFVERPEKITAQLLDKFEQQFPMLSIVPMRRFDGKSGTIVLPGLSVSGDFLDDEGSTTSVSRDRLRENEVSRDKGMSWGLSKEGNLTSLQIFAMPRSAPIWRWAEQHADEAGKDELGRDFPLVIAASRTLFSRHFRYENYRNAIAANQAVPCVMRMSLPPKLEDPNNPSELKSLVLEVKEGALRTAFQSFRVIWVDSFPMSEDVAFIMPLSTVELLMAAESRPQLHVDLEGQGRPSERIEQIWLRDIPGGSPIAQNFRNMAACLGAVSNGAASDKGVLACNAEWDRNPNCDANGTCPVPRLRADDNDIMITASKQWPLRHDDVAYCAARSGVGDIFSPKYPLADQIRIDTTDRTPALSWRGPSRVEVPCQALIETDYDQNDQGNMRANRHCKDAGALSAEGLRGVASLPGYPDAMIYASPSGPNNSGSIVRSAQASNSPLLQDVVAEILHWKPDGSAVFSLDPAYESALVRFGVLSTLLGEIALPLEIGFICLSLALTFVILTIAFMHRRAQYGLLMMAGVRPWQIHYVVAVQIALGCAIGCAIGYLLFSVSVDGVNRLLAAAPIIKDARALIGLDMPTFLEKLTLSEVTGVWIIMSYVSCLIGAVILLLVQGVSHSSKAPIDLLKP